MGYYVKLRESNVVIPNDNLDEAFNCFHRLEVNYDHLKYGGSSRGERWFSWMNDWTKECKNAIDVFERLGFDVEQTNDGLVFTGYDSKTGQEDLFFRAISHLILDESYMMWVGEEGDRWVWLFKAGKMYEMSENSQTPREFRPDFNNPPIKVIEDGK